MITARNYAAQLEKSLIGPNAKKWILQSELRHLSDYALFVNRAIHFAMPDDAKILGNHGKSLYGDVIKLPYHTITVEYFGTQYKSKNVILARQFDDGSITISSFSYVAECDFWFPCLVNTHIGNIPIQGTIKVQYQCPFPKTLEYSGKTIDSTKGIIDNATFCLVELLEALSCRNVTTEPIEKVNPSVNSRRIKAGKLPICETKMLVIDTKAESSGYCKSVGGSHASPRQHLRRGHIRRHPTAGNLWINSCVVGDPSKGTITKSYEVR